MPSSAGVIAWIAGTLIGAALLALPDSGPRVFDISDLHGPGWLDLAGIAVLMGAWVYPLLTIVRGRDRLRALPKSHLFAGVGLALTAAWWLVVAILADLATLWWVIPALILAALQVAAFRAVSG